MSACRKLFWCIVFVLAVSTSVCSKKKKKPEKGTSDTNVFNFMRLVVFRLIYGFASMIGAEEGISDFMGGILVPPSLQDDDYRDYIDFDY